MAHKRDSMKSYPSMASSDSSVLAERKSKRLATAGKDDMLSEIDLLQEEVELANARLRSATEEVQQLRRRVDEQDDGHFNNMHRSPQARGYSYAYGDLATEAEVRWIFFVAEKSRLQSEKGWRQALKDSKKMLEEQLSDAHAQTGARGMELINMKTQCCDGAKELEKEKKLVTELKAMVKELQTTLASERLLLTQANEKNSQLQEELIALQYSKESDKMTFARSDKRFVTCNLASQLSNYKCEDSEEDEEQGDGGVRSSTAQLSEDGPQDRPFASGAARRELEAQAGEPQRRSQQVCEQCEVLREELARVAKGHDDARLEARDTLRRFEASEDQRQAQMSEMQRRAQLAEKEFRALQQRVSTPWWSRIACHCAEKRPCHDDQQPMASATAPKKQVTLVVEEEQPPLSRPPRAAVHMEPAKNPGASWIARPLG